VKVLKLLIEKSYLGQEMHRMASGAAMPESVKKMLAEIQGADISGGRDEQRKKAS
jgi:hypothetical protein